MAAGEYLKTAAASLHRASDHLKQQAKDMQSSLTRMQSDKKNQIDRTSNEIKARQVEQAAVDDQGRRSYLSIQIQKLQDEIVAAQQELKQAEANIQAAVQNKLGASTAIEGQAKQLENQAGSIDS